MRDNSTIGQPHDQAGETEARDWLSAGLVIYFVALIIIVAAMLVVPLVL